MLGTSIVDGQHQVQNCPYDIDRVSASFAKAGFMERLRSDLQRAHRGERPALVMGIVHASASGNLGEIIERAIAEGKRLLDQGAEILDIVGRPLCEGVSAAVSHDEVGFTLPVLTALSDSGTPISITTDCAEVAKRCIGAGAQMVNDPSGLRNPEMARLLAAAPVMVCSIHRQGLPHLAHYVPSYPRGVVKEILSWGREQLSAMREVHRQGRLVLDPGIGLGKSLVHNYQILAALSEIHKLGAPIMVGLTRRALLHELLNIEPESSAAATVALNSIITSHTSVAIMRVHEVLMHRHLTHLQSTMRHVREAKETLPTLNLC